VQHANHEFWKDDVGLVDAVSSFRSKIAGHRQVTDAYLLGLAIRRKGRLATLDQAVQSILGPGDDRITIVELIP